MISLSAIRSTKFGERMLNIKASILSIALLIIMAGAAVSPVLADINMHFTEAGPQLVRMVITLPALMIVPFSFLTGVLAKKHSKKHLALFGLIGYLVGGLGGGLSDSLTIILLFRALLGASVGILSPLANSLIADYFFDAERTKMMGYSAAANNLGGGLATVTAGLLATYHWRYAFSIYGIAFVSLLLVLLYLPKQSYQDEKLLIDYEKAFDKKANKGLLKWALFTFLMIIIFFSIPTHLDFFIFAEELGTSATTGWLMGLLTAVSFATGIIFQRLATALKDKTSLTAFLLLFLGFTILSFSSSLAFISAAIFLTGLAMGILIPLIMDSVTKEVQAKDTIFALAVINFSLYLGQFISPLIPGLIEIIAGTSSIRFPFYVSALITLFSIIAMLFSKKITFAPSSYLYEKDQ